MKAFSGSRSTLMERAGLILLLTEKLIPNRDHDERSQTDILTSGSNLAPAFPD
jgi:hypothetical protein